MNQLKNTKVSSAPKTNMPVKSVSAKPTADKVVEKNLKKNVVDKSEKPPSGVDKKTQDKIGVLDKNKLKSITDKGDKKTDNEVTNKNKIIKPSDKNAPEKGALDNKVAEKVDKLDKETREKIFMEKVNPNYDDVTEEDWPGKTVNELGLAKQFEDITDVENAFGEILLFCCCPDNNNNAVKNGEVYVYFISIV